MAVETLLNIAGAIGVGLCLWPGAASLGRLLSWIERSEIARQKAEATARAGAALKASAPKPGAQAIPPAHLAAIAAAVGAMGGAYQIVHVGVARGASAWTVEGRWLQQTSHRPH